LVNPDTTYAIEAVAVCKSFWATRSEDSKAPDTGASAGTSAASGKSGAAVSALTAVARILMPHRRKTLAVDHISFQIAPGEIFGVVGPNGSGKSTLIRMMSTLLYPDEGIITILGRDVMKEPYKVRQLINRVSVEAAFFKKLSAYENLLYAARLYGVPGKQALKRAHGILETMGIEDGRLTDSLQEFSRGMQQKVAIARSLITDPPVLLLDEPTTGLDPRSKRDVQTFLLDTNKRSGTTIFLTSHDMVEIERMCHRVAIIHKGRFVIEGTVAELKALALGDGAAAGTLEDVFIKVTGEEWLAEEDESD